MRLPGVRPEVHRPAAPASPVPGGELLSRLGHELRSPLSGIVGLTRVMLLRVAQHTVEPTELTRQLELLHISAVQSLSVIERLVDLVRLDADPVDPNPGRVDAGTSAHDVAERYAERAAAAGRRIRVQAPADPVPVPADGATLGRLLDELVDNAVRYTTGDEIRIEVRPGPSISISDDGPGIPAPEQARLFDLFERGAGSTGTGLGLPLAVRLARRCRAQLDLHSPSGGACTVTVRFAPGDPR